MEWTEVNPTAGDFRLLDVLSAAAAVNQALLVGETLTKDSPQAQQLATVIRTYLSGGTE